MPTPDTTTERKPLRCGQQGLLGIAQGIIDVLRPCAAYAGREGQNLSGVAVGQDRMQTLVPVVLDHVTAGKLSLARFFDLTSA
jgi:dihydroorotase